MKLIAISFLFLFSFFQKSNAQVLEKTTFDLQEYFEAQKKNILKTNLTSPLFGNLSFSFEHAFQPQFTLESRLGFILPKYITVESLDGVYLGFGFKFFTTPIQSITKKHNFSVLQGFYIQPELLLGFTNKNIFSTPPLGAIPTPLEKQKINYQIFLSNFGLQTNLPKSLVLDVFIGIGFGRDSLPKRREFLNLNSSTIYHQGIFKSNTGFSLAGKAGVRLGILL